MFFTPDEFFRMGALLLLADEGALDVGAQDLGPDVDPALLRPEMGQDLLVGGAL